ncbi:uncharacterized protein N7473_005813 [Penicillium subrubescens]|uniref:uncharacterized protein n=1 Tax=Penicillium subrubescens TaxID=1316194 RepID=UPI002544F9BF|nr:uncharacterized protein N7473_005813 [Penicillium subrubescens]KAJ5896414.1 hypothetical protein N7473_005813 [Penicillium subrubescens]
MKFLSTFIAILLAATSAVYARAPACPPSVSNPIRSSASIPVSANRVIYSNRRPVVALNLQSADFATGKIGAVLGLTAGRTVEVVVEDVAEAGEISRSSSFTLLIVGDEVVSVVTAAVATEVAVVVVTIATLGTSGVAGEMLAIRAPELFYEYRDAAVRSQARISSWNAILSLHEQIHCSVNFG